MSETESKPLQAQFDVDDYDAETVEGTGFEYGTGTKYTFTINKPPVGTYMQYGKNRTDGLANLYVLDKKKCPKELQDSYFAHPDQYEIFVPGEINGQQALVPGKDFKQFVPYMTRVIKLGWKCEENNRLVFMDLRDVSNPIVKPDHPEWESHSVKLGRALGYEAPLPKINGKPNPEKFKWDFLHVGLKVSAEVALLKSKDPAYKDTTVLDVSTIEVVGADGKPEPQKTLESDVSDDMKVLIIEHADGAKSITEIFKKIDAAKKAEKSPLTSPQKSELMAAITKMKDAKEILA